MLAQSVNKVVRKLPAWPIYVLVAADIGWLFWQALNGQMGPEPVKALEHAYGEMALKLIIVVLSITPLLRLARINLVKFRRALGLGAFGFVLAHLLVYVVLDVQAVSAIWADIVKRPYISVGMAGFVLMLPLAITSNNLSVRRMGGRAWRKLHWLTYPAAVLGGVHFVLLRKGWQVEPLSYLAIIAALLLIRLAWQLRTKMGSPRMPIDV
ncbi:protein-methionine-sulfoxide reductase heme-binding subunit MsrQ [Aquicoccus sp. G2-2]|uniref:protein-methionine-sulfoxide reductase heme-binding subunit MsrQ n=1 Tax=Aquicoccus sp. G2-2 TaxID=3092120 RepID=UPI002ADF86F8|nr:protein-methionine-sulfoxide reductase heme-binding subunit MsrQ [Aquicoccus sp. G2-2]MEA1115215.1 protein-methionine-sulfoxide reductase heme-binding subunit MsrQ [Aquicoccus sp. G2-2]